MANLFQRLEAALAGTSDPTERVELLAEQGCYAAREGKFEVARARVTSLRECFLDSSYAPALNWVMLIEGLLRYFETLGFSAQDRAMRSYVCSKSLGLSKLTQQSAAWLAHFEFERSNVAEVTRLVLEHDPRLPGFNATARLRFAMVLADAYMYLGERSKAQRWFELAHRLAVDEGDQVSLGALMYNRAVFGLASIRVRCALSGLPPDKFLLSLAAQELASAKAFESAVRITALQHLVLVAEGRIALLRQDYGAALELFTAASSAIDDVEDRPNKTHTLADIALCLWNTNNRDQALDSYQRFMALDEQSIDVDDQLVGLRGAVEVFSELDDPELLARARSLLEHATSRYLDDARTMTSLLARVERDSSTSDAEDDRDSGEPRNHQ